MSSPATSITNVGTRSDDKTDATRNKSSRKPSVNVGSTERTISTVGGAALALYGLSRGSLAGIAIAAIGGGLIYRGTTGHCNVYEAINVDTAHGKHGGVSVPGNSGIKVEKSITINKPASELYKYWRNFENLPRFMDHLESVTVSGEKNSHWVAKAPAGTTVEWDAEIINEKENELIAWRSLEGADVDNAGSVRFEEATGGRGTVVKVSIEYNPPGGIVGATIAKLFGEEPNQQVQEDLRRFKQVMETGARSTTEGQSAGAGR
ncbi:MAG: DUF2892 domain-containing protein [Pyrinomonadaceae bacterium MAG19_C2-C3]|nr:DUF2892 domain-containing protein [Pyrinomonadaceae bacterium MAG19_C2-C3]